MTCGIGPKFVIVHTGPLNYNR